MVKVMLVDDEAIEREGLRMILRKNRSDFEVVAEAKNGKEAVDYALSEHPDLVFMDIKMPEFDGLVAIEKIIEQQPNTKFVMVSAFDMFGYAKRAMKFGVKEYLLKPSKVSEVLEAYDRLVKEIEEERQEANDRMQLHQRIERASSIIEAEFIVSLMMDHVLEIGADDWNEWLEIDKTEGFAAVFSFVTDQRNPSREEKSKWYQIVKQQLKAQSASCFIGPLTGFQVPVFVASSSDKSQRDAFARNVIPVIQKSLDQCQIKVGMGGLVLDIDEFSRSYEEAIDALELVRYKTNASYLSYTEELKEKRNELLPFETEKVLIDAIKQGDRQRGLQAFEDYFHWISQRANYQIHWIQQAMEDFFIVLTRVMKQLGFEEDLQFRLDHFETTTQMKEAAKSHVLYVIDQINEWRVSGIEGMLIQAKDFIDQYYHTQITLEEVATDVGISTYYFSKLFKEYFHVSFVEYLTNKRLEQAKDLLLDQRLPLKEIALTVGYKDPNYFSRVFKKEMGLSPSQYRYKHQT
ncbi:two-component response regulator [Gracilibacillus halophilus YIM-C55.5]|uniref:Two-component response regulator n=1 Tax=Gracilibacillus halophilus YIM-C55.5 TaxID=1308866 RepID=N4WCP8_9BACI|nr:response regulator [Gracilibacillus halophilus]ENH98038.1 two-component response regulator [Gracilibacillus halophilus YIM-C55.5]